MSGIAIVGAGHTGLRAALAARAAGFSGEITLIDPDPEFPSYERPPLSKWNDGTVAVVPIVTPEQFEAARLTHLTDRVIRIDAEAHHVHLETAGTLLYDKLLLATGARARPLEIKGVGPIATLRSKADADAICAKAATAHSAMIIGAGFIGLELAASLMAMDVTVRVIETAPRILGRGVSPAVADIVKTLHESNGVSFDLNAAATADDIRSVDLVVAGIGSLPNTALAESTGLVVQNGILVDAYLRSSNRDIFAAGDCCACPIFGPDSPPVRLEAWTAAGQQGDLAGRNMVSDTPIPCHFVPWVWSNQYGHVLQITGLPDPSQRLVERNYGPDHHITFGLGRDGALAFAAGIAPGAKIAKDIRFAMKLIEAGTATTQEDLANPTIALKSLLRT